MDARFTQIREKRCIVMATVTTGTASRTPTVSATAGISAMAAPMPAAPPMIEAASAAMPSPAAARGSIP
ncbi:MAG: hypothetical protein IIA54_06210 [Chloroflexi bacterium]|nr:hypothetical protein [Chloroflexota bacterium]